MAADFVMKKGDRTPSLRCLLRDASGPKNLSVASGVTFAMGNGTTIKTGAAVVEDAVGGIVRYDWGVSDSDTVGIFDAEFVVTEAGKQGTYPNDRFITVEVKQDVS